MTDRDPGRDPNRDPNRDLDREHAEQRRLRRAAAVARRGQLPEPAADEHAEPGVSEVEAVDEENLAARRLEHKELWVDFQIRQAMARGDFDDLPGAGKPLRLPDRHDPDWWVRGLLEREDLRGVAPPALGLRREDQELDDTLDREVREEEVRRVVDDFNRRVVEARRQLTGGPPVVTPTRDPDAEVEAWRARRSARAALARDRARDRPRDRARDRAAAEAGGPSSARAPRDTPRRPWWRRRRRPSR